MTPPPWDEAWLVQPLRSASALLWRGVEAQHRVATMRLVDSLEDQAVLEQLLEASKPPLPPAAAGRHYLLTTPFRYRSPHPSRFRGPNDPGLWYGAKEKPTALAEVGYWRWRVLMDSTGLRDGELVTEHTLFQAQVRGPVLDLTREPWDTLAARWAHPSDYAACQALARAARAAGRAQWIRYESARRPGGRCAAVLTPAALSLPAPQRIETWVCKVTAQRAMLLHEDERLSFEPAARGAAG